MTDDFTIEGKVVDHNSKEIEGVYVEAYNQTCFSPNFLGMTQTEDDGRFKLTFPKKNYFYDPAGCIEYPNIFLIIRNQYKKLLTTNTRSNVHQVSPENVFNIKIPKPATLYSDQISHISLKTLMYSMGDTLDTLGRKRLKELLPEFFETIEDSKYLKPDIQQDYGYSGPQVPEQPKKTTHYHNLPWNQWQIPPIPWTRWPPPPTPPRPTKIFGLERLTKRKEECKVIQHDIFRDDVDVCIIGSGASGAILANKLAKKGKKVVLLEKGGYYDREDMNQREGPMMSLLWKNGGANITANTAMVIAQGQCLGGSTMINDAVCFRPPDIVLKEWRNEMEQMKTQVTEGEWLSKWHNATDEVWDKLSVDEVKPEELNENSRLFKEACDLARNERNEKYKSEFNNRNCKECKRCGFCHLGCSYPDAKQDMVVTYIHEAVNDDNSDITIYCNCEVQEIKYEGDIVTGVEGTFQELSGDKKFSLRINAKVTILAAGSIASSRILLNNNIAVGQPGQGKAGQGGLALHPATLLAAKFDREIMASEGIPMAYSCTEFSVLNAGSNYQGGGYMLESIFIPFYQMSLQLPAKLPNNRDPMRDYNKYALAGIMVRDNDTNGKVTIGTGSVPKVTYELQPNSIEALCDGVDKLIRMWFSLDGVEMVITGHEDCPVIYKQDDPELREEITKFQDKIRADPVSMKIGSAHPQGGNKMGDDDECVVDSNCQVRGFKNLFVCDASVFPSPLGVNPQITVMALATITANYIDDKWSTKFENIQPIKYRGPTCSLKQPMYCNDQRLEAMFNQNSIKHENSTKHDISILINDGTWDFDKNSLIITNNKHWRGFIPKSKPTDMNKRIRGAQTIDWGLRVVDTFTKYVAGFWKKFEQSNDGRITGNIHVYQFPNLNIPFTAQRKIYDEFPKMYHDVIYLGYSGAFSGIYDFIKIIDENTVLGRTFDSSFLYPAPGGAPVMTFCMCREYSAFYMDGDDYFEIFNNDDHSTIIRDTKKIKGIWDARIIINDMLGPIIKIVNFSEEQHKTLAEDDRRKIVLEELIQYQESDSRITTNQLNIVIREVNDNFMIGMITSTYLDQPLRFTLST